MVMVAVVMVAVVVLVVVEVAVVVEAGVVEMVEGKRVVVAVVRGGDVGAVNVAVVTALLSVCSARGNNPKPEGERYGVLGLAVVGVVLRAMLRVVLGVPGCGWVGKNTAGGGVAALLLLGEVVWGRGRGGERWGSGADERVGVGVVLGLAVIGMQHEIVCWQARAVREETRDSVDTVRVAAWSGETHLHAVAVVIVEVGGGAGGGC